MPRKLFDLPPIVFSELTEQEADLVGGEFVTKFTYNDGLEGFVGYPIQLKQGGIPRQPVTGVRIKVLKDGTYPDVDHMQAVGPGCMTPREEAILQLGLRLESTFNHLGNTATVELADG